MSATSYSKLQEYRNSVKLESHKHIEIKSQQCHSYSDKRGDHRLSQPSLITTLLFGFLQPIETYIFKPLRPIFISFLESSNVDPRSLQNTLIWCLLLLLTVIFKNIGLMLPFLLVVSVYLIWAFGFSARKSGEVSAYNVFNKNFETIQGTFNAEKLEKSMRRGGMN